MIAGAPRLNVGLAEVGLGRNQSENVGVGGGFSHIRHARRFGIWPLDEAFLPQFVSLMTRRARVQMMPAASAPLGADPDLDGVLEAEITRRRRASSIGRPRGGQASASMFVDIAAMAKGHDHN